MRRSVFASARIAIASVVLAIMAGFAGINCMAEEHAGAVYVLTNQAPENSVMVYARSPQGTLSFSGSFATGGAGMGSGADPLGSQGALVLQRGLLFAVNAGTNDISLFEANGAVLRLLDRQPSGGQMPVSIAVHGNLVYVLNAGGTPNIQGFFLLPHGKHLIPLPGSQRMIPGGAASQPAEVAFSPDGDVLLVTTKGTSQLVTFTINDGYAQDVRTTPSSGSTPFGFAFAGREFAVVSEAAVSALSSYEIEEDGSAKLISGSVVSGQAAACWAVATRDGRYAYTANAGSGTLSSYAVSRNGSVKLLAAVAANTGAGTAPIDMALTGNDRFLYVRDGATGMVHGFRVEQDGSLTPVGSAGGILAGAQGLAAR